MTAESRTIRVELPALLRPAIGNQTVIDLEVDTVKTLIDGLLELLPTLRPHLFDEKLTLRPHVLCFVDGVATRLDDPSMAVSSEVRFIQAVSGG